MASTMHICPNVAIAPITPISYAQIAFAAAISWLLFRHAPDLWAAAGMGLIAFSGAATVWLNARETAHVEAAPSSQKG